MTAFSIIRGVSVGTGITDVKRIEDSVRAGRNAILTAITQSVQVQYAFTLSDEALRVAGLESVHWGVKIATYLTPAVLALFNKGGRGNCVTLFIQNHIGTLCQIASAVSAIALIYFGFLALGITSLAILGIGLLDRLGVLPAFIRHPIHEYSPLLRVATGLVVGDLFEKIFAIATLVAYCYEKYLTCASPKELEVAPIDRTDQRQLLDLPLLERILNDTVKLEINPGHLNYQIMIPASDVDYRKLLTLFNDIDWTLHMHVMRKKFEQDNRFKELGNREADLVQYARQNLINYLDSIHKEHIAEGEIHDYERLQNYLKTITDHLERKDEVTRADALLRFAVEGGNYCGPEKFHVAEDVYALIVQETEGIPVETKTLFSLQDARTRWMEGKYAEMIEEFAQSSSCLHVVMRWLFDFQDLHVYNQFLNVYGNEFGLRKGSADNDHLAAIDPLTKTIVKNFINQYRTMFKKTYDTDFVIDHLQNRIGRPGLPGNDVFTWWHQWLERQSIDDMRKEALTQELNANNLLGRPLRTGYIDAPGPFDKRFIAAQLVAQGVLRVRDC